MAARAYPNEMLMRLDRFLDENLSFGRVLWKIASISVLEVS